MKVTIEKDFRGLKQGTLYDFPFGAIKDFCIVGENGCGKTSLLNAIVGKFTPKDKDGYGPITNQNKRKLSENISLSDHDFEVGFGFDASKEGSATIDTAYDASAYLNNGGFYADRKSHGEGELIYISTFLAKIKDKIIPNKTLICLDEFDKGLSLTNQVKVINLIERFAYQSKCNVLYSTHNPFLIQQSLVVFDFEKNEFVASDEYLTEKTGFKLVKS